MPEIPDSLVLATGYVAAGADRASAVIGDLSRWPEIFPGWLTAVAAEDEHFTATGTAGERYDLYPHAAEDERGLDVEVVDELGSADLLRLRLIDARGHGCFVVATASRLAGVSDADWHRVRDGLRDGLAGLKLVV